MIRQLRLSIAVLLLAAAAGCDELVAPADELTGSWELVQAGDQALPFTFAQGQTNDGPMTSQVTGGTLVMEDDRYTLTLRVSEIIEGSVVNTWTYTQFGTHEANGAQIAFQPSDSFVSGKTIIPENTLIRSGSTMTGGAFTPGDTLTPGRTLERAIRVQLESNGHMKTITFGR